VVWFVHVTDNVTWTDPVTGATLIESMSSCPDRLNWSLRTGAVGEYADEVFTDLVDGCRKICDEHFPGEAGYEIRPTWLSGPIEGVTFTVTRGAFRAQFSVQRYRRLQGLYEPERAAHEIRVVAARGRDTVALCRPDRREAAVARVTAWTGGALGLVLLALLASGVLSTWSQAVLLLPVLLGLRMYWAARIAAKLRRQATENLALGPAEPSAALAPATNDERWQWVLTELEAQRQTLAEQFTLRPFRTIPTSPAALASGDERLRSVG
jgi:hypothetical protein